MGFWVRVSVFAYEGRKSTVGLEEKVGGQEAREGEEEAAAAISRRGVDVRERESSRRRNTRAWSQAGKGDVDVFYPQQRDRQQRPSAKEPSTWA